MAAPVPEYVYRAKVVRWVDGDTADFEVDLGLYLYANLRFRLYGIDTPEKHQPLHDEAHARAEAMAPVGSVVTLKTFKDADKYGRRLGLVYTPEDLCVNETLIAEGLAYDYFGGNKAAEKAAAEDARVAQQMEHEEQ